MLKMTSKSVYFSLYLPKALADWIDKQAGFERRSRNEYVRTVLEDLKEGKLIYKKETADKIEMRKKMFQPLARV